MATINITHRYSFVFEYGPMDETAIYLGDTHSVSFGLLDSLVLFMIFNNRALKTEQKRTDQLINNKKENVAPFLITQGIIRSTSNGL